MRITETRIGLASVLVLAAVLRAYNLPSLPMLWDEPVYVRAGWLYLQGYPITCYNPQHPPLAKYLVALGLAVGGLVGARALFVAMSLLSLLITCLIAEEVAGGKVWGVVCSYLVAVDCMNIVGSRHAILEVPLSMFSALAIYLLLTLRREEALISKCFVAGVLLGLAIACKWSAIPVALAALLYVALSRGDEIKQRAAAAASLAVGAALGYLAPFLPLILSQGFERFVWAQNQILSYHMSAHLGQLSYELLIYWALWPIIVKASLWMWGNPVTWLTLPPAVAYALAKGGDKARLMVAWLVFYAAPLCFLGERVLSASNLPVSAFLWYLYPITLPLAVAVAYMLKAFWSSEGVGRVAVAAYLLLALGFCLALLPKCP